MAVMPPPRWPRQQCAQKKEGKPIELAIRRQQQRRRRARRRYFLQVEYQGCHPPIEIKVDVEQSHSVYETFIMRGVKSDGNGGGYGSEAYG